MKFFFFEKKKSASAKKKKSYWREWVDSIVFAVIAATLIRGLFVEAYAIPTASMENTMMTGDYLFVSKIHYGTRTPRTLLQLPLMHQKIVGTEIPSYLDWIELPSVRLPSISSVHRNDIVVFNYPPETDRPIDMKTFYVKRCVGMPGDSLSIINNKVFINEEALKNPVPFQSSYLLETDGPINQRIFEKYEISDIYQFTEGYLVQTKKETADKLSKLPFINNVTEIEYPLNDVSSESIYPDDINQGWTIDNFGPLYIPAEGAKIILNKENIALYKDVILYYEEVNASFKNGVIYIDGKPVESYTFTQDYYFMMGDNRHNSEDSRMWGFVPANHIVGKPLFVWFSKDPNKNIFSGIRWKRMFHSYN